MNKTTYTTKILYMAGSQCGNQYAPNNVSPYGTKWLTRVKTDGSGTRMTGTPTLIDSNWTVDQKKVDYTLDYIDRYTY